MIYLANTDTTVGFLSIDKNLLSRRKNRDQNKNFIRVCSSLKDLKKMTRIADIHKNTIRRAKKSTFSYNKNMAIRVSKNISHNRFIKNAQALFLYSTSANLANKKFDINFAKENSDIIVYQNEDFKENTPSNIYKINNKTIKKIKRK